MLSENAMRERSTVELRVPTDREPGRANDGLLAPLPDGVLTPARSLEQRMSALKEANRIRFIRADLKRGLKAGTVSPAALLDDPDCATMKLVDVLLALPKVGRVKANRVLVQCRVSPSKTLDGLTERQRNELFGRIGRVRSAA